MESLKLQGNDYYKEGKFDLAYEIYEKCKTLSSSEEDNLILHKNIVACLVKLEKYDKAITICQEIIKTSPHDVKTLYRCAFSLQKIGKYEEAAVHLKTLTHIDGTNKAVIDLMVQVRKNIMQKAEKNIISIKDLADMIKILREKTTKDSELINTIKKLHHLGKSRDNCDQIIQHLGIKALFSLFLTCESSQVRITACHCLTDLSQTSENVAKSTFSLLMDDIRLLLKGSISNELIESLWSLSDSLLLRLNSPSYVSRLMKIIIPIIPSNKIGFFARNRILLFIIKHLKDSTTFDLINDTDVIDNVLNLFTAKLTNNPLMVDNSTLDLSKTLLSTLYDGLRSDQQRKMFQTKCKDSLGSLWVTLTDLEESRAVLVGLISALLQSIPDVATELISSNENIFSMVLAVPEHDPTVREMIAVLDCLISIVSIKKLALLHSESIFRCFRKYFNPTSNMSLRIRALVGLSKTLSIDGFSKTLEQDNKSIMTEITAYVMEILSGRTREEGDSDLFGYALQAMLFLSLSADSKELLCDDSEALRGILESCCGEQNLFYVVSQIVVNLTNSYDQPETDENLKKLAQFAKEKIPTKHPKDSDEFVERRINKIVESGVFKSLRAMATSQSCRTRENVSRIFLAILKFEKFRGVCAQFGCIKSLISLAPEFDFASQSLARIGITNNPVIIFPDKYIFNVVGPLIKLLCISKTPLQNFEALMALGNIASVGDDIRKFILHKSGFQAIETCMFSEEPRIRLAATQCMCNMSMLEDVVELHCMEGTDRVKLLVVFVGFLEEEEADDLTLDLVSAAAGALAILSGSEEVCKLICKVGHWQDRMMSAMTANKDGITHRVLHVLRNVCHYGADSLCQELINVIRILLNVSRFDPLVQCARDIVEMVDNF